jgi:hypothetical protein
LLNVTDDIKEKYLGSGTRKLSLAFEDGTVVQNDLIVQESMELEQTICDSDQLEYGKCSAASFKVKLTDTVTSYKGRWFRAYIGISDTFNDSELITDAQKYLTDDAGHRFLTGENQFGDGIIPLGNFCVDSEELTDDRKYKSIVAYDKYYVVNSIDMSEWYESLKFPMSLRRFRDAFMDKLGFKQHETHLINDDMTVEKTVAATAGTLTAKTIAEAICEVNACFGIVDANGVWKYVVSYKQDALYPSDDLYPNDDLYPSDGSASAPTEFFTDDDIVSGTLSYEDYTRPMINTVIFRESDDDLGEKATLFNVETENAYIVTGNFLTYGKSGDAYHTIVNNFLGMARNSTYRPASFETKGRPWVELGDNLDIYSAEMADEIPCFHRTLSGISALRDKFEAKGGELQSEAANGTSNQLTQLKSRTAKFVQTVDEISSTITDLDGRSSELKQTLDGISSTVSKKVGKDEIISKINQSAEEISIEASKIKLEGYTTINEGFSIDEEGNMTAKNATINGDIYMPNGGKIIGGSGMIVNRTYQNYAFNGPDFLGFAPLGFSVNNTGTSSAHDTYDYQTLVIPFFIPDDFEVYSAFLTLYATTIHWVDNYNFTQDGNYKGYGHPTNLYIGILNDPYPEAEDSYWNPATTSYERDKSISRISKCWDGGGDYWTLNGGSGEKQSVDIAPVLNNHKNEHVALCVRSNVSIPGWVSVNNSTNLQKVTGLGKAFLNIYGYQSISDSYFG